LKIKTADSFEMFVHIYQTTGYYIPKEQNSDQKYVCMCLNLCQQSGSQNFKKILNYHVTGSD